MTDKEKAKAYDKAIERAKKLYGNGIAEEIFSELKEDETERIKKDLIQWIDDFPDIIWRGHYKKDIIAWLEEQESYYTFEIKEGHWYKCVCDYMLNGSDLMFKNDNLYYCRSNWRLRGEIDERNVKDIGVNGYKSFFRPATNQEIKDWLEKQGEDKKEINNFDVLPGLYKCIHRMFDGTPDGRLLFEIGNVYKCLSKHDRAEFEASYGHSVYLEDPVVCKYFIPFESKGEQASSQTNERAWLYLVSDVLTWKDGIGQYLDDPRVQELAKRLCSDYAQKLYNPSNSSNTGKNEQKSSDKIEQKFHKGDWITIDKPCQIINIHDNGNYIVQYCDGEKTHELSKNFCESYFHFWTIQDAKDSDVLSFYSDYKGKKMFQTGIIEKYVGKLGGCYNIFKTYVGMDWDNNLHIGRYMGCDDIQPATKEQRDALMKAMNDAEYEWDIEKKELKKKRKR